MAGAGPGGEPVGKEPDARFSFANERTFLAWIRTALGLMTAGLAITQLLPEFDVAGGRRPVATRRDLFPVVVGTAGVGVAAFVLAVFYPG